LHLRDPRVPDMRSDGQHASCRSAGTDGGRIWAGALVGHRNAPTALFHLLNMLEDPDCRALPPSSVAPWGFVGCGVNRKTR